MNYFTTCLLIAVTNTVCLANVQPLEREKTLESTPFVVPVRGDIWPAPQVQVSSKDVLLSISQFKFNFKSSYDVPCDVVEEAFRRYFGYMFSVPTGMKSNFRYNSSKSAQTSGEVNQLYVNVKEPCPTGYPNSDMDESYQLDVKSGISTLHAVDVWGALRGLESFAQLIWEDDSGLLIMNSTAIKDYPRFGHRGILLDTSRHYQSLISLKENIEIMSWNKYNVFHWHIVDKQSFPYQSTTFPDLSGKGAWYPETHIYTVDQVKEIIRFARLRGIRVIPEFDTPGHTDIWANGIPDLITTCYSGGKPNGLKENVNPTLESTYVTMKELYTEITALFPDQFVHLGGDEVNYACWQSNPQITAWMAANNMTGDYSKLEQYYENRLLGIVEDLKKSYIIWQDVIDKGVTVAKDTIAQAWIGAGAQLKAEILKITKLGYRVLVSGYWYLDYISYGEDWRRYYVQEPTDFNGTVAQKALILGGEACLWGEFVDSTNLTPRLWPRATSVAERLWSAEDVNDVDKAAPRIVQNRCKMMQRGVAYEPVWVGACRYEFQPTSHIVH